MKPLLSHTSYISLLSFFVILCGHNHTQAQKKSVYFETTPCFLNNCSTLPSDADITFGYLTAPENRNKPSRRQVKIAVAILKSKSASPKPDPIIYLNGGPGGFTLNTIHFWLTHYLRADRDLILMDFRGVGYSKPELSSELNHRFINIIAADLTDEEETQQKVKVALNYRKKLLQFQIDLGAYNSAAIAQDIEDLRISLGYRQWNLYGISYGTRIAQTVMRDFPKGVRSVILDSAVPIGYPYNEKIPENFMRSLNILLATCKQDPECSQSFKDLKKNFYEVIESLNKKPMRVTFPPRYGLPNNEFVLNSQDMLMAVHQMLYNSQYFKNIPRLLQAFKNRNAPELAAFCQNLIKRLNEFSFAHYIMVNKYENSPFGTSIHNFTQSEQKFPQLKAHLTFFKADLAIYDAWKSPVASVKEYIPVKSDIPALILAGQYDPITPPYFGKMIQKHLSNSYFFEFPSTGHGVTTSGTCAENITMAFVNTPTQKPIASCIHTIPPPDLSGKQIHQHSLKVHKGMVGGDSILMVLGLFIFLPIGIVLFYNHVKK